MFPCKTILLLVLPVLCFLFSEHAMAYDFESLYALPEGSQLVLVRTVEDNIGMKHETWQQYINGVKAENCYLLVHIKDGEVSSINGKVIEANAEYQSKTRYIKGKRLVAADAERMVMIEVEGNYRYAYKSIDTVRFEKLYIDVETNDTLRREPFIYHYDVQSSAMTYYYGEQPITCNKELLKNTYTLIDNARNIYTFDATLATLSRSSYTWSGAEAFSSSSLLWEDTNPAYDVHWGMEQVYDYYLETFNQRSYDNNGGSIRQYVNPPSNEEPFKSAGFPNNSAAIGSMFMAYGLGDGVNCNPLVTIDIIGHEFTHMVTAANGEQNLPAYGEGGALNESFADIFGNAIERYALGECDWICGRGVMKGSLDGSLRSLQNPKSLFGMTVCPNTYKGRNWKEITGEPTNENDMDGVHYNCGVQNYWFYLLAEGGSGYIDNNFFGESFNVDGIGIDKAMQIVYRNLLYYITSSSEYAQSREGSIQATIDLYGKDSQEYKSVLNAWHAVGLGEAYIEPEHIERTCMLVARRSSTGHWFFLTSQPEGVALRAIDAGSNDLDDISLVPADSSFVWTINADAVGDVCVGYLSNGVTSVEQSPNRLQWNGGTAVGWSKEGTLLNINFMSNNRCSFSVTDNNKERYLSLNRLNGADYGSFIEGTSHIYTFTMLEIDSAHLYEAVSVASEQRVPYSISASEGRVVFRSPEKHQIRIINASGQCCASYVDQSFFDLYLPSGMYIAIVDDRAVKVCL